MRPWILPALALGWLLGVLVGSLAIVPRDAVLGLGAGAAVLLALGAGPWRARLVILALLAACGGVLRANAALQGDRATLARWETFWGKRVELHGVVDEGLPQGAFARVTVGQVRVNDEELPGSVRTTVPRAPDLTEGAYVVLRGMLLRPTDLRPFGTPVRGDPERVFARHRIFGAFRFPTIRVEAPGHPPFLTTVRERLREALLRALPEPSAGLYSAMLLSYDRDLPRDLRDRAAAAGVLHLVAISGSHIGLLAWFLLAVVAAAGLSRRLGIVLTLGLTGLYLLLVGLPESGVRSGLMGGFVGLAVLVGRQAAGLRALLFSAALMTAADPRILLGDVGFQLSALAVWGLLVLFPLFRSWTRAFPDPFHLRSLLLLTVAAELATLPVTAYTFGRISLIGPFTNLLAVWLFPLLLAVGTVVLLLGLLAPPLTAALAPLPTAVGGLFLGLSDVAVRIPLHAVAVPPVPFAVFLGSLAVLFLGGQLLQRTALPHSRGAFP